MEDHETRDDQEIQMKKAKRDIFTYIYILTYLHTY